MKATIIVAAFAAVFACTPALAAGNLVTNGGFETGDFTGWDQTGDLSFTFVYGIGQGPVDQGNYSAAFGPLDGYGSLSQFINTTPGQQYLISFDLANTDPLYDNVFSFSFDDGFQVPPVTLPAFDFGANSFIETASGIQADVTFLFYNPDGYFLLDNVTVTPIPEPSTWGLMLAGFVTIGAMMRRRQYPLVTA